MTFDVEHIIMLETAIARALNLAIKCGQFGGRHYKMWVIDQMVRELCVTSEVYEALIKQYCNGENGPDTHEWDVGIPP